MIRHPDLSRLTDNQLAAEFKYSYRALWSAVDNVTAESERIYRNFGSMNTVPLWKLVEDISLHADRLQAIREEIEYRKIP